MEVQFIYLTGTLLAVDVVVLTAWAVSCIAGVKIGYGWRKLFWLILAVRLLIPLRILMRGIYEQKPAYLWQIELSMEEAAGTRQSGLPEKRRKWQRMPGMVRLLKYQSWLKIPEVKRL